MSWPIGDTHRVNEFLASRADCFATGNLHAKQYCTSSIQVLHSDVSARDVKITVLRTTTAPPPRSDAGDGVSDAAVIGRIGGFQTQRGWIPPH